MGSSYRESGMKKIRLAYFSHDSISEGVGRSQILSLCRELSIAGVEVNLFSFEKIPPSLELENLVASSSIRWTWFPFVNGGNFPAISRINTLRKVKGDFDVIHARGDLPAFAAVLRNQEPVLWDIRSLWTEQKKVLNPKRFNILARTIIELMNQFTSRRVSAYNTLTNAITETIKAKYPRLPLNHSVVSTCVDTKLFTLEPHLPKISLGLLSGSFNSIYDSRLIREFNQYVIEHFGHKILWIRGLESSDQKKDLGQQETITSNYDEVSRFIKHSSYGICICRNDLGDSLKAAMPTKIAEFLSVGRPVIVNSLLGDVKELLVQNNVAVTLDSESDIPTAAQQLIRLISDPTMPFRSRKVAEEHLSLKYATQEYLSVYRSIAVR
jgi:glycosyltransferase involved in cell wall biosynthesis